MAVLPDKSLERYELRRRIAVGGMAEVFRAVAYGAHGFEKPLAIKRILPELAQDPEFEQRFIAEAKLAVQLTHANIVTVLDFGRFAGGLFIAMEYVDGLDLAALLKWCREHDQLIPIPAAFQMAIEIARGLDFAHQHGVIHRDVSPSNILLSKAGEVKIADFGIAVAAAERRVKPEGRRRIMGKWRYMSPEQTRGEDLTFSSDNFSGAAVLFELFTGDKLFPGEEAEDIIDSIHNMKLPLAAERRPGLPPQLDVILGRCLERNPDARPQKPGEIVRALTELSYESSIVATALDVAEAVAKALEGGRPAVPGAEPKSRRRSGLDDLIRRQLGDGDGGKADEARRTAVDDEGHSEADPGFEQTQQADLLDGRERTATVVRKGVDADGLTVWELEEGLGEKENTIAAVPSAIRLGKSTGSQRALEGLVEEASPAPTARKTPWLVAGVAVLLAGSVGAWALFGRGGGGADEAVGGVVPPPDMVTTPDAAPLQPGPTTGTLIIDSVPGGALVWVDGKELEARTPTTIVVSAGEPHRVEVYREGYARWTKDDVVAAPGSALPLKPTLEAVRATLIVTTDPAGAIVRLGGEEIGKTPLELNNLMPRQDATLTITKKGFLPIKTTVSLTEGESVRITRKLRPVTRYGHIRIFVSGWAEVYLGKKRLGVAPREVLRLPLGRHKLRLYNPQTKKERVLHVTVVEDETRVYRVSW